QRRVRLRSDDHTSFLSNAGRGAQRMSTPTRRLRVVVVDDEATAREGVARLVAADPDLQVVAECATGAEAVTAIITRRPDLVLLDVQMPHMDGFEVMRAVGPDWM